MCKGACWRTARSPRHARPSCPLTQPRLNRLFKRFLPLEQIFESLFQNRFDRLWFRMGLIISLVQNRFNRLFRLEQVQSSLLVQNRFNRLFGLELVQSSLWCRIGSSVSLFQNRFNRLFQKMIKRLLIQEQVRASLYSGQVQASLFSRTSSSIYLFQNWFSYCSQNLFQRLSKYVDRIKHILLLEQFQESPGSKNFQLCLSAAKSTDLSFRTSSSSESNIFCFRKISRISLL